MDVGELRQQLLNCSDGALEDFMYDSLGSKVDTLSLTALFQQLEKLAVVEVEETVYNALNSEDNTLSLTNLVGQIKEH